MPSRREFLHTTAAASLAAALPQSSQSFELEELTIAQLQEGMRSGRWSARTLTAAYLQRIENMDQRGPALQHVLETNPDALAIADRLDQERRAGRVRGPLHGIPVLIKDNIDTADRMHTSAGSLALATSMASRDAFIVERLRAAGAVLLGKTNLSEWANFRSTHSSSGWSGRGGQGKNPYALDRSPCGSSSGTGGAIAASFAAVGVGTETDGSIVCPSSANGLVGLKPTLGLVSRSGIIPIAHSQDTAGPMARTVRDAAILLNALVGADPRDPATRANSGHVQPDYTSSLDPNGLRGARIGVARKKVTGYSDAADNLYAQALDAMKRAGAIMIDPADIPHVGEYDDTEFTVLLYEFKTDLNAYLATLRPGFARTLKDLIDFNEQNRAREMPYFGQEIFLMAQEKGALTDKEYIDALAKNQRLARAEGIDPVMKQHSLDALVAPTGSPAWTIDLLNGDHFLGASSTPAAVAGYPTISVPMGFHFGLPVGLTFIGAAWSEPTLLKLAYSFEQIINPRKPPSYQPVATLS